MFNFRYAPKSCRPPNLPISEKFDSTYDGSDRPLVWSFFPWIKRSRGKRQRKMRRCKVVVKGKERKRAKLYQSFFWVGQVAP